MSHGAIYAKYGPTAEHSSNWVCMNFQGVEIWGKESGTWKAVQNAYVKEGGSWQRVYPSNSSEWTSSNRPGSAEVPAIFDPPQIDPSYPASNLTGTSEARWTDDVSDLGDDIQTYDYSWTTQGNSDAGLEYGAIERFEVTMDIQGVSITNLTSYTVRTFPGESFGSQARETSSPLGSFPSFVTYTYDYVVGGTGWDISSEEAGLIATDPSTTNSWDFEPRFVGAVTGTDESCAIKNTKLRFKYKYPT